MSVEAFVDTNVLVYAVSHLDEDMAKTERARSLMKQPFGISSQVLQEFYVTVTRKIRRPLDNETARQWVEQLAVQPCVSIDPALVLEAVARSRRYQISYWDGAIIAAAETLGASVLYTEDLNHTQMYGSVRAVNPFLGV